MSPFPSPYIIGRTGFSMKAATFSPIIIHFIIHLLYYILSQVKIKNKKSPFTSYFYMLLGLICFINLTFNFCCCSRTCNTFRTPYVKHSDRNSDDRVDSDGVWINKHDLWLCFGIWFSQMPWTFQCWSCSPWNFQQLTFFQIFPLYPHVSDNPFSHLIYDQAINVDRIFHFWD